MDSADTPPPSSPDTPEDEDTGRGWYSRGYLPHYDSSHEIQSLTWRLADSIPRHLQEQLEQELASVPLTPSEQETLRRKRIETMLDRGYGECWLRRHACASVVRRILQSEDGSRYALHAWVIMPNHVHALVQFFQKNSMGRIVHAWKGNAAQEINTLLGRTGEVWQEDFWDRYIRNEEHYQNARRYIILNPVRAGLVSNPARWKWSWSLPQR